MIGHLALWEHGLTNPYERARERTPPSSRARRKRRRATAPPLVSTTTLAASGIAVSVLAPLALALRIGAV